MTRQEKHFNKNILIAVDDSANARRAVSYVGQLLGGLPGFRITVMHVIPEPEEDFFRTDADKDQWLSQYRKKIDTLLAECRHDLIDKGFSKENTNVMSTLRYCPSMAECILSERDKIAYSTIVVGRQGISKSEEFLFGSVSSKIIHHAKNCTVWVVE